MSLLPIDFPQFYYFLNELKKKYPIISVHGCLDANGKHIPIEEIKSDILFKKYEILQWDRVFGNRYSCSTSEGRN